MAYVPELVGNFAKRTPLYTEMHLHNKNILFRKYNAKKLQTYE